MVVSVEDSDKYVASDALVAVTLHVPVDVTVSVDPLMAQPLAVPLPVTAYETEPVPDPPVVVRVNELPADPDVVGSDKLA